MGLTDFGKTVRKARLDANETLATMAEALGVSPAFLSALETGRKNISEEWVKKIIHFFEHRGVQVQNLGEYADISNKSVSLAGSDPQKQMLIAGFARSNLDAKTLAEFARLLGTAREKNNMRDHYQLRGYLVAPKSIQQIREAAERVREVLQLPDGKIQVEKFLESLFRFGITIDVIGEQEMPGYPLHSEAYCIPDTATIYLTNKTYLKACRNDPRSLFTIFHELGHLILCHSRTLHRGQENACSKPFYDSEWQADQFSAEMIMPLNIIISKKLNSPCKIQERFGVSFAAAQARYEQLVKRGDIK